jgi:hypothetical protein
MRMVIVDIVSGEETPIPSGCHVKFGQGDNEITITVRDDAVEVSASRRIVVYPRVSNVIIVGAIT